MNNEIKKLQDKLIKSLERLDNESKNIDTEVARSNATSQLVNTYIKLCNLIIRVEESKDNVKNKLSDFNEK